LAVFYFSTIYTMNQIW